MPALRLHARAIAKSLERTPSRAMVAGVPRGAGSRVAPFEEGRAVVVAVAVVVAQRSSSRVEWTESTEVYEAKCSAMPKNWPRRASYCSVASSVRRR